MAGRKVLRVLELGCGISPLSFWLSQRHAGKQIEYHGVDLDPSKPERTPPKGMTLNFHKSDVAEFLGNEKLAPSEHFDEVHLHMIDVRPRFLKHLRQIHRVLKPRGLFYAIEQSSTTHLPSADEGNAATFHSAFGTKMVPTPGRSKEFEYELVPHGEKERLLASSKNAGLARHIRQAGFEILRATLGDARYYYAGPDAEIPPGVEPEPGRKFPKRRAKKIMPHLSNDLTWASQFLILRKLPAKPNR